MTATFSRRAAADIREIWDYTVDHWGGVQAEICLGLIESAVDTISGDPKVGRPATRYAGVIGSIWSDRTFYTTG